LVILRNFAEEFALTPKGDAIQLSDQLLKGTNMPPALAFETQEYPGDLQLTASEIRNLRIRVYNGFDLIVYFDASADRSILAIAANLYTQLAPLVVASQALALMPAPTGTPHIFVGTTLLPFAKDVTALAAAQFKGLLRRLHWAEGVLTAQIPESGFKAQAAEMTDIACASYGATVALLRMHKPFFDHVHIQIDLPALTTGDAADMISPNIALITNAQALLEIEAEAIPD